ncbi:PWI domain mRNA processing protein [Penicillium longicatenatum]|uniref:PWI domain mRNA processing protein n=1 Tax=Penicillium longicatenatum TaxID=1561947 RepID=UPI002547DFD2|nr:PWI domain mRNA processing protein [Penicillium longicatenatum]KAJ5639267.1 PWI domain mRNA processing protein [Penicillium longicatenatum]
MAAPVDQKLLRKTKFPPEFSRKVDMQKVNIEVMKKSVRPSPDLDREDHMLITILNYRWIAGRISEILGNEDDVVIELCFGLIEGTRYPDIKAIQIQLTGFLDKDTPKFCKDLWLLCLSGQENPQGVPKELLEAKKLELIQEKAEAERAAESARRQREQDIARERELGDIRNRERGARGDRERGQRAPGRNRGFNDNYRRRSRSPPPRNRSRDRYREPPRRNFDSYVPSSSNQGRRSRSPSQSRSRSRSLHSPSRSSIREPRHAGRARSPDRRRGTFSRSISPGSRSREGTRRSPNYGDRNRSIDKNNPRSPIPRDERRRRSFSRSVTPSSRRQDRKNSGSSDLPRYRQRSRDRGRRYERDTSRLNDEETRGRGYGRRRSRSRSRSPRREHERRRSLERHTPAAHRRRDTSVSTPEKQPENADQSEDPLTPKPLEMQPNAEDEEMKDTE